MERDDSIVIPKRERLFKSKLNYLSIEISLDLRDLPLVLIIQQKLRYGSLFIKKGVNGYILIINNFERIILIANIINGYMRIPKIHKRNN